jgi:AcrR family transcriptional regulator
VAEPAATRRRPRDRKQQLVRLAGQLFVEQGFPHVSMAMLAERADLTAGALYRHFATKEALLQEVVRSAFADLVPQDGTQSLAQLIDRVAEIATERPELGVLWARESRYLSPEARAEVRDVLRRSERAFEQQLLVERPELTQDEAELVAWAIASVLAATGRVGVRVRRTLIGGLVRDAATAISQVELPPLAPDDEAGPAREPASRRERLLTAAAALFAERGYRDTALADIGAAADVTGPSLYSYFASKADLLEAVVDRANHALWIDLDRALQEQPDAPAILAALVDSYQRVTAGWSADLQLSMATELGERGLAYQREYVAEWVALLDEARPGLEQGAARLLVQLALAVVNDLSCTPHLRSRPGFGEQLTSIALAALLAETTD